MMIILAIPIGILCLLIAWACHRSQCGKQALIFSALGFSSLIAAVLMIYGSHWLLENM